MLKITFRYKDALSKWEWRTQSCVVETIHECIEIYGLNQGDVEYEIISVDQIK